MQEVSSKGWGVLSLCSALLTLLSHPLIYYYFLYIQQKKVSLEVGTSTTMGPWPVSSFTFFFFLKGVSSFTFLFGKWLLNYFTNIFCFLSVWAKATASQCFFCAFGKPLGFILNTWQNHWVDEEPSTRNCKELTFKTIRSTS